MTLVPAGKLEELTHEMERYYWNILGLCEIRFGELSLDDFAEMSLDDRHKGNFSEEEARQDYMICLLVHKDMVSASWVADESPASSIRLRADQCHHHKDLCTDICTR